MSDEEEYSLVMPFVVVTSVGGPYDDDAYVAGYEMGTLKYALDVAPEQFTETIRTANVPQADLLAMQARWTMHVEDTGVEGWSYVTFNPEIEA